LVRLLRVDPLDPWAITKAMRDGRAEIWRRVERLRSKPGHESLYLTGSANQLGVRSSRRIRGLETATAADALGFRKYPDGIARSSWEIDIHSAEHPTAKGVAFDDEEYKPHIERAKAGDYFDIRYGCIVAKGVDGLLMAGRCLSAEHVAQSSLRIQQACLATGQAAGTAAALSLAEDVTPRELEADGLVAQLETDRAGVEPAFDILCDIPLVPRDSL